MKLVLTDHRLLTLWAADCAERVLPVFAAQRPDDERPHAAVAAARAWVGGDLGMFGARAAAFAAHAAARETDDEAARAAARAAGHAAATVHVATHAPHAAAYALKAIADPEAERAWQLGRYPAHLPDVGVE